MPHQEYVKQVKQRHDAAKAAASANASLNEIPPVVPSSHPPQSNTNLSASNTMVSTSHRILVGSGA